MNHDAYPDSYIRGILNTVKTIAMVGISPKDNRPSYFAFKYLLERGYRMIPVNPGQAGKEILGQKVYAKLSDIPEPVDMVDIFRASQFVMPVVQEALTLKPKPQVIWMQLSVRDDEAAKLAEAAGIKVVMDRCPKIEYGRLSSRDFLDGRQLAHAVVEAGAEFGGGGFSAWASAHRKATTTATIAREHAVLNEFQHGRDRISTYSKRVELYA